MPWAVLLTGCLAGTAFLAVLSDTSRGPLDQGTVRLAFLPAVAALAFVPRVPFRPLAQSVPVPAWVVPSGHLLLAVPVLAATCWAQLRIAAHTLPLHTLPPHTLPPHAVGRPPAVYPLVAQLTGWCAVTVAAAACAGRSRYADLGAAIAAPVSFGAIAFAWYVPVTARLLAGPPATGHAATIAWCAITSAALALTCMAMRDQWHRYWLRSHHLSTRSARRVFHRLGAPVPPSRSK
jgi:hypothetical protein